MKKFLRHIPEVALLLGVMFTMLYTASEVFGMRWLAWPLVQLAQAFK